MSGQSPNQADLGALVAAMDLELSDRQRQIDLLKIAVERHKQASESAESRSAMLRAALDRHLAQCGKNEGATQRLIAQLAEATARRKEQVAIIERRDRRIVELQKLVNPGDTTLGLAGVIGASSPAARGWGLWLKRIFSIRRT